MKIEALRDGLAPLPDPGAWPEPDATPQRPLMRPVQVREARLGGLKIAVAGLSTVTSAALALTFLLPTETNARFAMTEQLGQEAGPSFATTESRGETKVETQAAVLPAPVLEMTPVSATAPLTVLESAMDKTGEVIALAPVDVPTSEPDPVGPQTGPRFIVRFENAPEAERILRLYRQSRSAARLEFGKYAQGQRNLAGFSLVGLTPSGEAVLSWDDVGSQALNVPPIDALVERLTNQAGVRYADPNVWSDAGSG